MTDAFARLSAALSDRYRIEREVGEGGMATVYLAEDLRHHRKVAIKVLKPELAAVLGADRFVQEIQTTASLQHPNILPLFDSGTADGFLYYVMPYIEGESLRDRLNREKQLPVQEAVDLTTEVADALDYAHRHGVIHRDIKPENILIHAGRPMVADFGIALAVSAAAGGRMTETGLSLGTPHYMSPEQATAEKDITGRSDIYSLASVLYEMLTGDPPHVGSSAQQIIMKIVTEEAAPVTKLRKSVPPSVAAAVSKALEKLPADRFDSARVFADALVDPGFRYGGAATAVAAARRPAGRLWKAWAVAATAAALALGTWAVRGSSSGASAPVGYYFDVTLPRGLSQVVGQGVNFDVATDGSKVVLVAQDSAEALGETFRHRGRGALWVRASDRIDLVRLKGTENARDPRFSPDGKSVAYISGDSLNTVSLTGAPPVTVVLDSVKGGRGGGGLAWGGDGYLYYARQSGGVWRVPAGGGRAERLLPADSTGSDEWFDALPDGKGILFSIVTGLDASRSRIAVLDLRTRKAKLLLQGTMARFAPPGALLYATAEGRLLSVPFDADHLEVAGSPRPILDGIQINAGSASYFATSASGALLYAIGGVEDLSHPVWVSDGGSTSPLPGMPGKEGSQLAYSPRISPDGGRVAFVGARARGGSPESDIWIYDVAQQTLSPLTRDEYADAPFWSPDGTEVGYRSYVDGRPAGIYARRADFTGKAERLVAAQPAIGSVAYTAAWTPDGRALLYADSAGRLLYAPLSGQSAPRAVLGGNETVLAFSVSPDGRWVAYESAVSGSDQVYVAPVSGPGGRVQVSVAGGRDPVWTRDGTGILYVDSGVTTWTLATVRTKPTFGVTARRKFADASDFSGNFDTAPDGRILAIDLGLTGTSGAIRLVTDWRRALGVGR